MKLALMVAQQTIRTTCDVSRLSLRYWTLVSRLAHREYLSYSALALRTALQGDISPMPPMPVLLAARIAIESGEGYQKGAITYR